MPGDSDEAMIQGVRSGNRRLLAKAITLMESTRPEHRARADAVLTALLPHTGGSIRLGISGAPGVGKSTFIETFGLALISRGHKVAVLALDPSSILSGGSVLGDKTRMERLSVNEAAYVRPSPSSGTLGGVAERTRETLLVCEAAGFDVVIVETVGVGQSEVTVAGMVDVFVVLQLPHGSDDLQALKKGVTELADVILINKADLDPDAAARAAAQITNAMRILRSGSLEHPMGRPQTSVMQVSALTGAGIDAFWSHMTSLEEARRASCEFDARRGRQAFNWMWDIVNARILAEFRGHPAVRAAFPETLRAMSEARLAPTTAARKLLDLFER